MDTQQRRLAIKESIKNSDRAISATTLAEKFNVSRQIICGDVALLRASQEPIIATPRGYVFQKQTKDNTYVIACLHDEKDTQDELQVIVDFGGSVKNVIVTHPIYGELIGSLHISSRFDVEEFINLCKEKKAKNLSAISGGIHFHTITCNSVKEYERIIEELDKKNYLYHK